MTSQPQQIARPGPAHPGRTASVRSRRSLPNVGHLTAAQVLGNAAFVALRTSAQAPSPSQFVYKKVETSQGKITQSWLSVDGARNSIVAHLTIFGCVHGKLSVGPGTPAGADRRCTPVRAYFPDMPTRASEMRAYLQRTQGVRPGNLNDLAKTVGGMLDTDYLLPAQQAALYEFLARTPGITVVRHATDAAGRPGIGVRWIFGRSAAMLIFDLQSFQYLGTATKGIAGQLSGDALLQTAIVDNAGQLPQSGGSTSE